MRDKKLKAFISLIAVIALVLSFFVQAAALDHKYTFEDIGMSVKVPRDYYVISVNSQPDDEAFEALGLDFDETITAFHNANIYLQAVEPDSLYRITLTVFSNENSRRINNYLDLTAAQRQEIADAFLASGSYTSASEAKRAGSIFFDLQMTNGEGATATYVDQLNTVVNGMNINVTLQKTGEEILPEENKALINIASSLGFDHIERTTGPAFDWWRILLWLLILAAISVAISLIYKQYNKAKKKKLEERRLRRVPSSEVAPSDVSFSEVLKEKEEKPKAEEDKEAESFDETLGYSSEKDYRSRAATDLDSFDIKVKEKNVKGGIAYFEDEGESIDEGNDYFDTYFSEPTEARNSAAVAAGTVSTYLKIAMTHIGYFFKNLWKMISKIFKGDKTNR